MQWETNRIPFRPPGSDGDDDLGMAESSRPNSGRAVRTCETAASHMRDLSTLPTLSRAANLRGARCDKRQEMVLLRKSVCFPPKALQKFYFLALDGWMTHTLVTALPLVTTSTT